MLSKVVLQDTEEKRLKEKQHFEEEFNKALAYVGSGNYEEAGFVIRYLKISEYQKKWNAAEYQPEWGIIQASYKMAEAEYEEALKIVDEALGFDNNNYELYYLKGLCHEQLGAVEDAYYAYRIAIFLGKGTQDEALMTQQFQQLCSYAGANAYELGISCQRLIESRLRLGEYDKTYEFLGQQLYDRNRVAANVVLSENNMLLHMMLEIVLCEKKRMSEEEFKADNTIVRYECDVDKFNQVYRQVKLIARRIWFGAAISKQQEMNEVLANNKISADMLAVIVKYSVREEYWQDTFARLAAIVQYRYPQIGEIILQYRNWIAHMETIEAQKCMEPSEADNGAVCMLLDYKMGELKVSDDSSLEKSETQNISEAILFGDSENTIAFIFCTNDKLYRDETVDYVKRLEVPQGMKLMVVDIWNAPGMSAGYNIAMKQIKAKYKIYIHHDTFIICKDILAKLITAFKADEKLGLIGIASTKNLEKSGKWWGSDKSQLRMNLYQDAVLNILKSVSIEKNGEVEEADALDGILLATQADIEWREDLFDGWHFYDISQCYEFRKNRYKTAVLNGEEPFVMHETTMKKDKHNLYDKYCDVFVRNYDL